METAETKAKAEELKALLEAFGPEGRVEYQYVNRDPNPSGGHGVQVWIPTQESTYYLYRIRRPQRQVEVAITVDAMRYGEVQYLRSLVDEAVTRERPSRSWLLWLGDHVQLKYGGA